MKYQIKVEARYQKVIEVEADNECEAEQKAESKWLDGDITFSDEHCKGVMITRTES